MCPHPSESEPCRVVTAVPGISVTAAVKCRTGQLAPVFGVTDPCCLYRLRKCGKCENKSRSQPKICNYGSISGMQDNDHVTYIWQPSSRGVLETCSEYVVRGNKLIQNQIKSQKIKIKA